jgi:CheY-like chemotaxis protein
MTGKAVILCVGDTSSALEGLKMLLEENGYRVLTVLTATNLKETVQTFVSNSVDLALLDYHIRTWTLVWPQCT